MGKAKKVKGYSRFPLAQYSSIPMFPKRLDVSPEFWILTPGSLPYAPCFSATDDRPRTLVGDK
jgi:hypothetical protein